MIDLLNEASVIRHSFSYAVIQGSVGLKMAKRLVLIFVRLSLIFVACILKEKLKAEH